MCSPPGYFSVERIIPNFLHTITRASRRINCMHLITWPLSAAATQPRRVYNEYNYTLLGSTYVIRCTKPNLMFQHAHRLLIILAFSQGLFWFQHGALSIPWGQEPFKQTVSAQHFLSALHPAWYQEVQPSLEPSCASLSTDSNVALRPSHSIQIAALRVRLTVHYCAV